MIPPSAGTAAELWRTDLEGWALPQHLLDAVTESPYEWPAAMFRRRNRVAEASPERTPTERVVGDLLGVDGSLLDVGAGTGRASLPFASRGHAVTAVEQNEQMADALAAEAADRRVTLDIRRGTWPALAAEVPQVDVALCANVVYDVAAIAPFVAALSRAGSAAVVELTAAHPWSELTPLYVALHGLGRPHGPTAELFVEVVAETVGSAPSVIDWERPSGVYFKSWDELLGFYGRRLLIGPDRHRELRRLLESEVQWTGGRAWVGGPRRLATVWWKSD